MSANV